MMSCLVYDALFVLGKHILIILVFKHIYLSIGVFNPIITFFLSIVFCNLSCDLYDISRNISLLM